MKKLISLILALVMVMGLAISASAASITITPPTTDGTDSGITYTAYKIFDATISDSGVAYTIEFDSPYFATIQAATNYFTLNQVNETTTYTVSVLEAYNEDAANTFADTLKAVKATTAGTLTKQSDGNYKLDGLDDGYYLVTSSVGSDLILDTIGDIFVTSKNTYPSLEKKVEGKEATTADMGEVLPFTIEVSIPEDAVGAIVVHDKMTGLEYQDMTAVEGITAATTNLSDDCAVEFTLSANYVAANKGKKVTITYTAKVTADVAYNEAWLVDDTFTSKTESTEVLSIDIVIEKVDKTNNETKLKGAKFVLKNSDGKFYKVNETTKEVAWVEAQADATVVTTDDNGAAKFENIADGTYSLVETEAPAGYNLLTAPVRVPVTAAKNDNTVVDVTAKVENSTGSALPSTGGMGTTLFYVIGGLMMAGAAVLLVTKRRVA